MLKRYDIKKFMENDEGAVTVDWVVLTAAIVGLATTAAVQTQRGVMTAASTISGDIGVMTTGTP